MTMFQNLGRMLGGGSSLKIECEGCRRLVTWPRDLAYQKLGPDAAPFDIRRRLICAQCGGRAKVWI